jgi:AcrR family transcriptional regulator
LKSQLTRNRATRADWLAAALDAIHKEGPKGLNIQALARQLNISKTSFYWHFTDKAELVDTLIDLWCHEFTEIITENVKLLDSPPRQRLAKAMEIVDKFDLGNYDSSFRILLQWNLVPASLRGHDRHIHCRGDRTRRRDPGRVRIIGMPDRI